MCVRERERPSQRHCMCEINVRIEDPHIPFELGAVQGDWFYKGKLWEVWIKQGHSAMAQSKGEQSSRGQHEWAGRRSSYILKNFQHSIWPNSRPKTTPKGYYFWNYVCYLIPMSTGDMYFLKTAAVIIKAQPRTHNTLKYSQYVHSEHPTTVYSCKRIITHRKDNTCLFKSASSQVSSSCSKLWDFSPHYCHLWLAHWGSRSGSGAVWWQLLLKSAIQIKQSLFLYVNTQ